MDDRPPPGRARALLSAGVLLVGPGSGDWPPPGWIAGDAHEFFPACDVPVFDPDARAREILDRMVREGLDVVAAQLWIQGAVSCDDYFGGLLAMVDGREHPLTRDDPEHVLQLGVELAVVQDQPCQVDEWGHVLGLNVMDGRWDPEADYPAPNLDFLRAQPGALVGYAHVFWPVGDEFPSVSLDNTRFFPILAPFDAALGRLDLLGVTDVDGSDHVPPENDGGSRDPWYGLYYKLESLGLQVSVAAGSVGRCYEGMSGDSRTWVRAPRPPDYDAFVRGIAAGSLSLSDGADDLLELEVEGRASGEVVELDRPASVTVEARLHVRPGVARSTRIEIVCDGEVVATEDVELPRGGEHVATATVPIAESGWIAARLVDPMRAHTGVVRTRVGGRAPVDAHVAAHFVAYADQLLRGLRRMIRVCERCGDCAACVTRERRMGDSEEEILAYVERGRRAFRALESLARLPEPEAHRRGRGGGSLPWPAVALPEARSPFAPLAVDAAHLPPGSSAFLVVGLRSPSPVDLGLLLEAPVAAVFAPDHREGGVAQADLELPYLDGPPVRLRWFGRRADGGALWSDELWTRLP